MKKIALLIVMICLVISACSTSTDEPSPEFTGPWKIIYYEEYHGIHNNSSEFEAWFNGNKEFFNAAQFSNYSGSSIIALYSSNGDWIELEDYNKYYNGDIEWIEYVNTATESEIKTKVSVFESFTLTNNNDKMYDRFTSYYEKANR